MPVPPYPTSQQIAFLFTHLAKAKNLGIILDFSFYLIRHIQSISKSCLHDLQNKSRIQSFLSISTFSTLDEATILSYLNYCSSLLTDHLVFAIHIVFYPHRSGAILWKLNLITFLLCSKPFSSFPSLLEYVPKSLPWLAKPNMIGPLVTSLTSSPMLLPLVPLCY